MATAPEVVHGLAVLCSTACADNNGEVPAGFPEDEDEDDLHAPPPRPPGRPRSGPVIFHAEPDLPLARRVIRQGEVLHLSPEDGKTFRPVLLALHPNGMSITPRSGAQLPLQVAWSPFSLVQACRLHTMQADEAKPWLRLFKVSVFHHGLTHFFATHGAEADTERLRWVADFSRCLRVLTQSLLPAYSLRTDPHPGASWTSTRLLAGYLLLYDDLGVSLVYGEFHSHWDNSAAFAAYEDDCCDVQIVHQVVDMATSVSDRVGVDCSCFSLCDHHFAARTCAEKMLWLRVISNVKVKLRHWASNPSRSDLRHYRQAVREHIQGMPFHVEDPNAPQEPLLPRRGNMPALKPSIFRGIDETRSPSPSHGPAYSPPPWASDPSDSRRGSGSPKSDRSDSRRGSGSPETEPPPVPMGPADPPSMAPAAPGGSSAALMAAAAARLSQTRRPKIGFCPEPVDDGLPPPGDPPSCDDVPAVTRRALLMGPCIGHDPG